MDSARRPPLRSVRTDTTNLYQPRAGYHTPNRNTAKSPIHHDRLAAQSQSDSEELKTKSASTSNLLRLGKSELSHGTHSDIKKVEVPSSDSLFHDYAFNPSSFNNSQDIDDESLLVDVLPSFEMYNVLHRHIPQGNVDPDRHDFPPTYQEESTPESRTDNSHTSLTPNESTPGDSSLRRETFDLNDLRPLNTVHYDISNSIPFDDDLNDSDNIIIDKLYSLPKLQTPIDIDIRVTKNASKPHSKSQEESMLKEYTSGDIIHGYCLINNRSNHRYKFEMFYVTLEGYISLIDRDKGKRTLKRFLRMVDLSASWSYTDIDLSSGIDIRTGEIDNYDGSIIGLKNNRILEPHTQYKKFFMFKLPNQLLDVTCKHEQFSHCLLPPSFGVDKFKNNFKYANIKINNVLGFGHQGIKGSPILTNDLSDDDISVNYTIDARIVGKDMKTKKLNIMKEREYNLRVMPFGFSSTPVGERASLKQLNDLKKLIHERFDALDKVFDKLDKNQPILTSDIHEADLSGSIDTDTDLNSQDILRRKLDQLHINNRLDDSQNSFSRVTDMKYMEPLENTVEAELSYKFKNKYRNKTPHLSNGFLSGFLSSSSNLSSASSSTSILSTTTATSQNSNKTSGLKSLLSPSLNASGLLSPVSTGTTSVLAKNPSDDKISSAVPKTSNASSSHYSSGLVVLTSKIPQLSLPYSSPSLIRKTNKPDANKKHENWVRLTNSVPEEERSTLTQIPIKLSCIQSNNGTPHEPPSIHSVTTQLICLTGRSDNSIPIKLHTELLMNEGRMRMMKETFIEYEKKYNTYKHRFKKNGRKINELFNIGRTLTTARELSFKDFISDQIKTDIESLANFDVRYDILNDIFKKQATQQTNNHVLSSPSHHPNGNDDNSKNFNSKWLKMTDSTYEKTININLELAKDIKETLIPNFETCLCCRFYCIRVTVKFENHFGTTKIDIPVNIKKLII